TASPITVSGLTNETAYTFSVTATNAIGTSVASSASNSVMPTAKITDIDGNVYNTVTIGTQTWMKENLKATKYNDGTAIPNITDNTAWAAATTGAYSDYGNTPANSAIYGRLYNWYVVDNNATTKVASNGGKNVCPTSWHVSTDAEWTTLITYLGGGTVAGGKLKETGTTHWITPNTGATNESGFTGLAGGYHLGVGSSFFIGNYGFWWSSTEYSSTNAWVWGMSFDNISVIVDNIDKRYGGSVRCVRDF
ncbi:MAG TPA: fibrobacter succinogenes major paralogous domain-containing protein, partial [Methylococcales bacterium]